MIHKRLPLHTKFPTHVYTIHNFNWPKPKSVSRSHCVSTSHEMFASCMRLNKAAEKSVYLEGFFQMNSRIKQMTSARPLVWDWSH